MKYEVIYMKYVLYIYSGLYKQPAPEQESILSFHLCSIMRSTDQFTARPEA